MTVSSAITRADYRGNNVTTLFTVPFYFLDSSHIKVLRTDNSTVPPTSASLVLNSDYVVTGAGVQIGGQLQTTVAPTAAQTLTILRNVPFTQLIHYVPNDPFPAATHEQALDQLTMETQEIKEAQTHSLQLPTYEAVPATLLPAAQRAGTVIGFDATGAVIYVPVPTSIGAGDMRTDTFISGAQSPFGFTPGTTVTLQLSRAPGTLANVQVYFDGTYQGPDQIAALSGTALTFNSPIPVGIQKVYVQTGTSLSVGLPVPPGSLHSTVRTDANTNYDGIDQSTYPEAPVLNYSALESFTQSYRNSKHTAKDVYQSIFPGVSFFDGLQGVTAISPGMAVGQATGIAGYVKNMASTSGINGNGVAVFGAATAEVDNSAVWGLNTLIQDSATRVAGTGTGRILIGAELDFNLMNPGTEILGVSIGGNSLAQSANALGFIVNTLGNGNKWSTGFTSIDGAAFVGFSLGKAAAGNTPNTTSQPGYFQYVDGSGNAQNAQIQAFPGGGASGGNITIGGTAQTDLALANGNLLLPTGHVVNINSQNVLGGRIGGWGAPTGNARIANFNATTATLAQVAQAVAQMLIDGQTHGFLGA